MPKTKAYLLPIWLSIALLFASADLTAQLREFPLPYRGEEGGERMLRASESRFPFWDDFSRSTGALHSALWLPSGASVAPGMGIDALSYNVVVLDAISSSGKPYASDITLFGAIDSLTSLPIDLGAVPAEERSKVLLNFHWQAGGRGSYPNQNDSLVLQFKNAEGEWNRVWSTTAGEEPKNIPGFKPEWITLRGLDYHNVFQFRFIAYGNMSGAFDTWLIDYVRLAYFRNGKNTSVFDRTLGAVTKPLFGRYYSMPMSHYLSAPEKYVSRPAVSVKNLNVENDQPMTFSAVLIDTADGGTPFAVLEQKGNAYTKKASSNVLSVSSSLDASKVRQLDVDSLGLEMVFSLSSGDREMIKEISASKKDTTYYESVDLRVNDTLRTVFNLNNYYAYDDGSAEYAAGISQQSGEVAVKFHVEKEDLMTHVRINFPDMGRSVSGTPFQLRIYSELNAEGLLHQQDFVTGAGKSYGSVREYKLYRPVRVSGDVYLGWYQKSSDFLAVGLDKNTDSGDSIYFRISNDWVKNDEVSGSLLLRPVFKKLDGVVTGAPSDELFNPFPNPCKGQFTLGLVPDELMIFDNQGRSVPFEMIKIGESAKVYLNVAKGLYLVKMAYKGKFAERRLLVL